METTTPPAERLITMRGNLITIANVINHNGADREEVVAKLDNLTDELADIITAIK
jgi:hypothetical protein